MKMGRNTLLLGREWQRKASSVRIRGERRVRPVVEASPPRLRTVPD